MPKPISRIALACTLAATLVTAWADGLHEQLDEELSGGSSLFQQKQQLTAQQKKLADEAKALVATGAELDREQADLNRQAEEHNQAVTDQKTQIDKTRQGCNNEGEQGKGNTAQDANACNNTAKSINQKTADINSNLQSLQSQQQALAARFDEYQRATADWNKREQANVTAINRVNKHLDNWLNFSYNFMAGADFQMAIASANATPTCGEGTSRISASAAAPLDDSARFILACLRAVKHGLPKPAS